MARVSQYRAGSDHQNASQIAIAPFRDRPELLFAGQSRHFALRNDSKPFSPLDQREVGHRPAN
jgi:hypothetical protein